MLTCFSLLNFVIRVQFQHWIARIFLSFCTFIHKRLKLFKLSAPLSKKWQFSLELDRRNSYLRICEEMFNFVVFLFLKRLTDSSKWCTVYILKCLWWRKEQKDNLVHDHISSLLIEAEERQNLQWCKDVNELKIRVLKILGTRLWTFFAGNWELKDLYRI